jgi:hypothetical protein
MGADMKKNILCGVLMAWTLTSLAVAEFVQLPQVPIDRLIANTSAYIKEHPEDAMGPYTLARIHYLAFATRSAQFRTFQGPGQLPSIEDTFGKVVSPPSANAPRAWTDEQLREHLRSSLENYQKALKMNPGNGLFHLGLASVSESAFTSGLKLEAIPGERAASSIDSEVRNAWRELAIREYLAAHDLSAKADTAIRFKPLQGLISLVSYESGQRFIAMVMARGIRPDEKQNIARVQGTLRTLNDKPFGAITPIVFSLVGPVALDDLLDPERIVAFNLDGTGRPQDYPWLRPDTGMLVWDPENTGRITSGHQLFGSVSFNMFWIDGYRALDVLDDDRDGMLREDELAGLAVWFDRNQDGASQPGEVIAVRDAGIASLSVRATGLVGSSPMNSSGLRTIDGRVLPTYDWVTEPVQTKTPLPKHPTS